MIYSNMVVNATVEQQFVQDIVNVTAKRKNNLEAFENEGLLNEPKISVGSCSQEQDPFIHCYLCKESSKKHNWEK